MVDGARKALDIRALNLTTFCMVSSEWYYQQAKAALEAAQTGGHGTTRLGESIHWIPRMHQEHVQWSLTAAHGPFDECSFKENCMGRSMIEIAGALKFALKQYVSPRCATPGSELV